MPSYEQIYITKENGDRELFDAKKLSLSLKHSGASDLAVQEVIDHIVKELKDEMSTTYIYRHAFSLLRKIEQQPVAARYSLEKRSLLDRPRRCKNSPQVLERAVSKWGMPSGKRTQ